jgi:RNA polymerase sigma-70 factor (ECF subfamily)
VSLASEPNAEEERLLADSVGMALLVVLETLTPAERLAFVLHDTFDLPFDEIAGIVGCTPSAARQLASRARRRVRGAPAELDADADLAQQRAVVAAFLSASRSGDLAGLLAILDPSVVLRADAKAVEGAARASGDPGTPQLRPELQGASEVANAFLGRARAAQPALINGAVGAAWAPGGQPRVVFDLTIEGGKVVRIDVIADPLRLSRSELTLLG